VVNSTAVNRGRLNGMLANMLNSIRSNRIDHGTGTDGELMLAAVPQPLEALSR